MKKMLYVVLLAGVSLFLGCEKEDFSPEQGREFASLTVFVADAASQNRQGCGGLDYMPNITVALYTSEADRAKGINAVDSKLTESRGGVTFNKLQGGTYYIAVRSERANGDRTYILKKGDFKYTRIAVEVTRDAG